MYWWFFNHTRASSSGSDSRNLLKLSTKNRTLQGFQAYSRLYYETKLKDVIDKEYKVHTETVPKEEQKTRFAFAAALTKTLLDSESDEVKAEVEAYRKKESTSKEIKLEDDSDDDDDPEKQDERDERNRQMQE